MKKLTINEKYAEFRNTYKVSKMLLGYVWHLDRKLFLGNLISIMIPGIVPFLNAIIYAEIINLIVRAVEGHAPDYRYLFSLIAARIISLFILDVSFALQRRYEVLVWTKLPMHLYQDVLASITNLDIERFEDSDFKDHLERVRDSFNWRPMNMLNNLFLLFQGIIQVTIAAISLIYLNWLFAVLLLVASLPMFFYQTSFANDFGTSPNCCKMPTASKN